MALTVDDQFGLVSRVKDLADRVCSGRLLHVLEGGYDRRATAIGILNTLAGLAGSPSRLIDDPYGKPPHVASEGEKHLVKLAEDSISQAIATHRL